MNPKITVVIPVYNTQQFLPKCLDSLINQSFADYEAIVVDDGSTDKSGQICDSYQKKDSRFIVIHKENGGVSSARNYGIMRAKGQYLAFLDSDDWVEPEWLHFLYQGYTEGVDLVGCNIIYRTDNSVPTQNINSAPYFWDICGTEPILKYLFKHPDTMNPEFSHGNIGRPFVYNKLYKMSIIRSNNILFDERLEIGEDYKFNYHYIKHISCARYTPSILYNYYQAENNTMSLFRRKKHILIK